MNITFHAIGLKLEAEVNFAPFVPGTHVDPPELAEVEFVSLTYGGVDVSFLLDADYNITDALYLNAITAAERVYKEMQNEYRAELLA